MAVRSDTGEKIIAEKPEIAEEEGKTGEIDTIMSMSQNLSENRPQLTIFYGGSVKVFDGIPGEKVMEIMRIATAAATAASGESGDAKKGETDNVSSSQAPAKPTSPPLAQPCPKSVLSKMQAEFPIARTHSLQRFLERRRDRLVSKRPYPASPSVKVENDS